MIRQAIHIIFLSACILLHAMSVCAAPALPEDSTPVLADSVIQVEDIQVTAIKQGLNLRNQPVTASVIGRTDLERAARRSPERGFAGGSQLPHPGLRLAHDLFDLHPGTGRPHRPNR